MQFNMKSATSPRTNHSRIEVQLLGKAFLELCTDYSMDPATAKMQIGMDRLWIEGGFQRLRHGDSGPDNPKDHRDEYVAFLQQQQADQQLQLMLLGLQARDNVHELPVSAKPSSRRSQALEDYYAAVYELCQQVQAESRAHGDFINAIIARTRAMQTWSKDDERVWVTQEEEKHQEQLQPFWMLEEEARRRCLAAYASPPSCLQLQQNHHQQQYQYQQGITHLPKELQHLPKIMQQQTHYQQQHQYQLGAVQHQPSPTPQQQCLSSVHEEERSSVAEQEAYWWAEQHADFRGQRVWAEVQLEVIREWRQNKKEEQLKRMKWEQKSWLRAVRFMPLVSWVWTGHKKKQEVLP